MADDHLSSRGLFVDDLQKLRVMDPDVSSQTQALKDECGNFVGQMADFQKMSDGFISLADEVSKTLEKEKMAAIGARNKLKSASRSREQQHQQLHSLVVEKRLELERLKVEYEALKKIEQEQQEFIDQLILNQ